MKHGEIKLVAYPTVKGRLAVSFDHSVTSQ